MPSRVLRNLDAAGRGRTTRMSAPGCVSILSHQEAYPERVAGRLSVKILSFACSSAAIPPQLRNSDWPSAPIFLRVPGTFGRRTAYIASRGSQVWKCPVIGRVNEGSLPSTA
jgi:hypothetical protein